MECTTRSVERTRREHVAERAIHDLGIGVAGLDAFFDKGKLFDGFGDRVEVCGRDLSRHDGQ